MTYKHPAMTWLIKNDPDAALAVFHRLRDEYYTHGEESGKRQTSDEPDDVEAPTASTEEISADNLGAPTDSGPDELHGEFLHEVKPSISLMLADLLRVRFVRLSDGTFHRVNGLSTVPSFSGNRAIIAGMTFDFSRLLPRGQGGGTMITYTDAGGITKKPEISAEKPRGGKTPYRTPAAVLSYLALKGAVAGPMDADGLRRPIEAAAVYDCKHAPVEGVEAGRELLRSLGIDGSVPFEDLPFSAKRGSDAVAYKGARFIAGVTASKPTSSTPAPAWQIPDVAPLSPVLEEVAARGTLASIGIRMGYQGGYADRAGKKALLAAGRVLIADNDNISRKIAA